MTSPKSYQGRLVAIHQDDGSWGLSLGGLIRWFNPSEFMGAPVSPPCLGYFYRFWQDDGVPQQESFPAKLSGPLHRRFSEQGSLSHLKTRAEIFRLCRRFFDEQGFTEVDTPQRVQSPGTDPYLEAIPSADEFLITSPEFHMKALLVGGMDKIYQLGHCFRGEEVGPWHQSEFTMLEWYRAFSTVEETMADTEALIRQCAKSFTASTSFHLNHREFFIDQAFERITMSEAFQRFAGIADVAELSIKNEDRYFGLLVDEVEPALAKIPRAVFLTEFPASQAALARKIPERPDYAERYELYIGGVELCNGYGELTDPKEQAERFRDDLNKRKKINPAHQALPYPADFIQALEEGMPPASGNALGLDRLIALCCGEEALYRSLPFPKEP